MPLGGGPPTMSMALEEIWSFLVSASTGLRRLSLSSPDNDIFEQLACLQIQGNAGFQQIKDPCCNTAFESTHLWLIYIGCRPIDFHVWWLKPRCSYMKKIRIFPGKGKDETPERENDCLKMQLRRGQDRSKCDAHYSDLSDSGARCAVRMKASQYLGQDSVQGASRGAESVSRVTSGTE